jgi:hypothetical protein
MTPEKPDNMSSIMRRPEKAKGMMKALDVYIACLLAVLLSFTSQVLAA